MGIDPNTAQAETWTRIDRFEIDDPAAAFPYSARLAEENRWTRDYAKRVIEEYKRFAFLCVEAGHPCSPSEDVDQAWHLHLIYTRNYWEDFCKNALRRPLHHEPTLGGTTESQKHRDWYARTLESYKRFFGLPPEDIWPNAEPRFKDSLKGKPPESAQASAKTSTQPGRGLKLNGLLICGLLVLAGCGATLCDDVPPFNWSGPEFLQWYLRVYLVLCAISAFRLLIWDLRQNSRVAAAPKPAGVYELAAISGGERIALAATMSLAQVKALKLGGATGSELVVDGPLPGAAHPVEKEIYAILANRGATRPDDLVGATADLPELKRLVLAAESRIETGETRPRGLAAPFVILLLIGIAKLLIGISRDKPVGYLLLLLAITGATFGAITRSRSKAASWRERLLRHLRARSATLRRELFPRRQNIHDGIPYAFTTALYGIAALRGTDVSEIVSAMYPSFLPSHGSRRGVGDLFAEGGAHGCGGHGCGGHGCGGGGAGCGGCAN